MKWTDSVKFECTKCGQCCREPGVVVLEPDDLFRLCDFLDIDEAGLRSIGRVVDVDGYTAIDVPPGQPCPFLKNNRCSVWSARPIQCRTYPFWEEIVASRADWRAEKRVCEGIGQGRVWTADDIHDFVVEMEGE